MKAIAVYPARSRIVEGIGATYLSGADHALAQLPARLGDLADFQATWPRPLAALLTSASGIKETIRFNAEGNP